ncbi:tagatose 1,6-diphosphate aldolase [Listeria aquatica]|uniref:tagatose 1,6-diphosphate aldolase n=1 Tax=Listeria aquatica TaxID=1494960 RepID=UPI003F6EA30C
MRRDNLRLSTKKRAALKKMSNESGIIAALAIDQRGSLEKMIAAEKGSTTAQEITTFKELVSEELTPFASAILLDPEYGLPASKRRDSDAGLLIAYEKTGYDQATPGRLPDLLPDWSVERIQKAGADAIKFLLYYDVDEDAAINHFKHVFIERIGTECLALDMPFFLELVSYDAGHNDMNSKAYAKQKPHKVIEMMKEFSKPEYFVDVLKVEVPVNMSFVEGFGEDFVFTEKQALAFYKEQSEATDLPFIFLSGGVTAERFQETLRFAKKAGSRFNGVLCGRATWKDGIEPFAREGEEATRSWLKSVGKENLEKLNRVLEVTASSWHDKTK